MGSSLQDSMAKIQAGIDERERNKVHQFPLWADPKRGIPNHFARSALFTARKSSGSDLIRNKEIFCQGGLSIKYTGVRLTQDHLDVYETIMHLFRDQPENTEVPFTSHGLLKAMGRRTGGKDHLRLRSSLRELTATSVEIKRDEKSVYWGSLLPEGSEDTDTGRFTVKVNRRLIKFFNDGFTLVEQNQRQQLARSPLARHLQGWISSHKNPYPVTVAYLYSLTGSETKKLFHFRANLKVALSKLIEAGVISEWTIDDKDKLHIRKCHFNNTPLENKAV